MFLVAVAVEACERNIELNGELAMSKVKTELADARVYMLTHENEFDVVSFFDCETSLGIFNSNHFS
jgi:tRNA G26 N,N-dimethylase Trm1